MCEQACMRRRVGMRACKRVCTRASAVCVRRCRQHPCTPFLPVPHLPPLREECDVLGRRCISAASLGIHPSSTAFSTGASVRAAKFPRDPAPPTPSGEPNMLVPEL